ncbi:hypothetical protein FRC02_007034 [Tulasnella sp. 418]|nr:hypothetical protein FRC02_007034 [Tulasnella sp. 418]
MSSSSQSSHSPSGTLASVEEEFLSPHIQPLSPTAHPIDRELYQELSVIQDDILTVSSLDDSAVLAFGKRWSDLQSRIIRHHPQGYLSEETLELYDVVTDFLTIMAQSLIEGEHTVYSVSEELLAELEKIFDADPSLAPSPKVSKPLAASSSHPSLQSKKPAVPCKRAPTEPLKTHRKRRAESGIPGQESLKFRPCRDFFMAHLSDPYPNPTQKTELMQKAKISAASLNQWFTNTRRRSNWMDIMKDHANGRKEDMKVLVERCLSDTPDDGPPIDPKAREAVLKMRTYVDELAREVISDTFLEVLEELTVMTENDAVKYQDGQRSERKKKNQIKREATSSSLADEGQISEGDVPKLLEKRKRPIAPAETAPSKKPRDANWVGSSMPPPASRSLKRSRESSPAGPNHQLSAGSQEGSPSKKLRTDAEDSISVSMGSSPAQLKVTTSLQSISTSSTLTDSIAQPPPVSVHSVIANPSDHLDWPMGRSSVDIVVPSPDLVTDLSGLTFDPTPFQSLRKSAQSTDSAVACAEWIKSLPKEAGPDLGSTPIAASFVPPPTQLQQPSSLDAIDSFWYSVAPPPDLSTVQWHMSPAQSFPPHTPIFSASPVPPNAGIPRQYSAPVLGSCDYSSPQSQVAYPNHPSGYPNTAYSMPPPPLYSDSKTNYASHNPTTPIIADSSPQFSWNEGQYHPYGGELTPLDIRISSEFYATSQ